MGMNAFWTPTPSPRWSSEMRPLAPDGLRDRGDWFEHLFVDITVRFIRVPPPRGTAEC